MRKIQGINEIDLLNAFAPIYNVNGINNFTEGTGKSQSFFFFTDNKEFVIKTVKESEYKLTIKKGLLKHYHRHIYLNNGTLLSRFFGLFSVRIGHMERIHFIVMNNLIGNDLANVEQIYDLKGSLHNRRVRGKVREEDIKNTTVLKDQDFLEDCKNLPKFDKEVERQLKNLIVLDAGFLEKNRLMDYSLLLIKVNQGMNTLVSADSFIGKPLVYSFLNRDTKDPQVTVLSDERPES